MLTTCFLAALIHGIVILGVTFSAPDSDADGDQAPALEVVLVGDQAPGVAANPRARYLSERNQRGSANTLQNDRALIPASSALPVERFGIPGGDGLEAEAAGRQAGDNQLIASIAASPDIRYFASPEAAEKAAEMPLLLEKRPDLGMAPNDDGISLRLSGEANHQLWIAADTRASDVAVYLDAWRRKVERVGTMNFPDAVRRQKFSGTPVLEVTIAADGKLDEARVRRSSGHAEVDEAAIRILRLAAPFDPFPRTLSAHHDALRIAYEWQFLAGAAQGSSVFYGAPGSATAAPDAAAALPAAGAGPAP
jgi:protein TonB